MHLKKQLQYPLFLLFGFLSFTLQGQVNMETKVNRLLAKAAIADLNQGFLLVRLKTSSKALDRIQKMKQKPGQRPEVLNQLKRKEAQIKRDRDYENAQVKALFSEYYTFSTIYYMNDTAFKNKGEAHFLDQVMDKNGEKINREKVKNLPYLVAYAGTNAENGARGIVFVTSSMNPLVLPFPSFFKYRYYRMVGLADFFFDPRPEKVGRYINSRLEKWLKNSQR